jgi:hypothetical protein
MIGRGAQCFRLGLALACLLGLAADYSVRADEASPSGQVEHLPRDQALSILGRPIATPDGKTIGHLVDILVDATGTPEAAVIDFGGFMGVGARKVAVHWSTLQFAPANLKQPITLDLTPDEIKAVPEYRETNKPAPVVLPASAEPQTSSSDNASSNNGSP